MRKLIVGNWKMNGTRASADELIDGIAAGLRSQQGGLPPAVAVCPPATLLAAAVARTAGSPIAVGAQDCHMAPSGAHTGDVSAAMVADAGARYVIVGHSERRSDHGESDETVRTKAVAALDHGLTPIICVGESEAEREEGRALDVIREQLSGSLPDLGDGQALVVAYEPVWAIGTGKTATPADVAEVHAEVRRELEGRYGEAGATIPILYGGSVKPGNATELLATPDVDGALVGGASLKSEDFLGIVAAGAAQG